MDNWCSIMLIVFAASYVVSQQLTSSSTIAPLKIEINTIGGSSNIINITTTSTTAPSTVTTTTTTTPVPSTTKTTTRPFFTTTPTISTTTTASEPLILNGGDIDAINREELARMLIENAQDGGQYGRPRQVEQQNPNYEHYPQFSVENAEPVYGDEFEGPNEKRSLSSGSSISSSGTSPTTIATYGSSVVNIPPIYGSTFGQPSAAKGLGYNVGYTAGQQATYGGGLGTQNNNGGLLGSFGRIIQMVGSGFKNLFNLGGDSSSSTSTSVASDKLSTGKTLLSGVAQAGLGLKALGLGVGIGTLKGLLIGTKIGLIKGLILAKIKQSLQQPKQNFFAPQQAAPSYEYRHDSSPYDGYGGYGYSEDQTAYPKGDYDVGYGYEGQHQGSYYDQPQYGGIGEAVSSAVQPGPSTQFGAFPFGVVVGAVKGAKDGIVRGLLSKGQQLFNGGAGTGSGIGSGLFNSGILSKGQALFNGGSGGGLFNSDILSKGQQFFTGGAGSGSSSTGGIVSSDASTQRQVFNPQ